MPRVTYLGAGGLYIYLLHPLALRALAHAGYGLDWVGSWPEQAALLCLAVLLTAVLASPHVRRLTRPVIQPTRRGGRTTRPRPEPIPVPMPESTR
ncbi:hypothetical protein [Streptomyces sp. 6N223]|uniref:hypothetical protein n=1 Tax=Streptomyces sp. 6N223 TaxID=3457412 RepID=UPI003FD645A1